MNFDQLAAEAEKTVSATQRRLPPEVRDLIGRVPVHCQPVPADDVLADGFEPDILGLFVGPSLDVDPGDHPMPPQILLYLENLWDFAEHDLTAFRTEVRITYLHELGHYLGLDEDQLEARGLE